MIIGITGPLCSGKGELSKMLEEKEFLVLSFGDEVRCEASARGIGINRNNLQTLGYNLTVQFGESYWSRRILSRINGKRDYVVEGFRYPGQVEEFRKTEKFVLLGIDADFDVRFKRYCLRGKAGDVSSLEAFRMADDKDKGRKEGGQNSAPCYKMRDYEIINNGSFEELRISAENILKTLVL